MDITKEVELIGPGHRRRDSSIRHGYWTPELANWTDVSGYIQKETLIVTTYDNTGARVTGTEVNACPVICITKNKIGEQTLTVQVTGNEGAIDTDSYVDFSGVIVSGFTSDNQYGTKIYRRKWVTGGTGFKHSFTIQPHTDEGQVFLMPSKRIYEITNVVVTPENQDQPLTDLSFYAMADNGSKILYSMNWNKPFEYARQVLYGAFGQPNLCPRCDGTGYFTNVSDTCDQCSGYRFQGPNASGFLEDQIGLDVGITQDTGDSDETFRNKVWAMKWWIIPTKNETRRYLAHFARIEDNEVEIIENDRTSGATGVERVVDVYMPYNIPETIIDRGDGMWTQMAKRCEPAGILVRFSFLSESFSGDWIFEDLVSPYRSGYISGTLTGYLPPEHTWGFYEEYAHDNGSYNWGNDWGDDWFFYNYLSGATGGDIASGTAHISGATDTYIDGSLTGAGTEWLRWAWPAIGNGDGDEWHTGVTPEVIQQALWDSGTFYYDNFWESGTTGYIQY